MTALLFDLPAALFWMRAIFSPITAGRPVIYFVNVALPLVGLVFGVISANQRQRKSDMGSIAIFLSLLLIGAGLLYGAVRFHNV